MSRYISLLLLLLVFANSGPSFSSDLRETLVPEELIGNSIEMEIDWFIEDVGAPENDFARAIAKQLESDGIVASISATYQNTVLPDEIYSLEIYEFARDFKVDETVRRLKPVIANDARFSSSEVNGHTRAEYAHESGNLRIHAVKTGKRLIIIGVLNEKADLSLFARKYFSWYARQQKIN